MRSIILALKIESRHAHLLQTFSSVTNSALWGQHSFDYMSPLGLLAKSQGNAPNDATRMIVPKETLIQEVVSLQLTSSYVRYPSFSNGIDRRL